MDKEKGKLEDRLRNFNSEPPPQIWSNLESHLAQKRERRGLFWWFVAAGIFLPVLSGIIYWQSHQIRFSEIGVSKKETNEISASPKSENVLKPKNGTEKNIKKSPNDFLKAQSEELAKVEDKSTRLAENNQRAKPNEEEIDNSQKEKVRLKSSPELYVPNKKNEKSADRADNQVKNFIVSAEKRETIKEKTGVKQVADPRVVSLNESSAASIQDSAKSENLESGNRPAFALSSKENKGENNKSVISEPASPALNSSDQKPVVNSIAIGNKTEIENPRQPNAIQNEKPSMAVVSNDSVQKKDSALPEVKSDSVFVQKIKADSSQAKMKKNCSWFVFSGVKASIRRTIAINQVSGESRVELENQDFSLENRLSYDAGVGFERFFKSWIGIHARLGATYQQDEISVIVPDKADQFDVVATGGELRLISRELNSRERNRVALLSGFSSVGLSLKPIRNFPVFRFQVGAQSSFWNQNTMETNIGGGMKKQSDGFELGTSTYFFQISASKSVPFSKGEIWIEPVFQYYPKKLFNLRPGAYSVPTQLGLQLSWKW